MGGIKMKEFNLDEFKKNPSQKVVTRDGREVRIICTDANNDFPIIALFCCSDNKEDICTYHKNGHTLNTYESPLDLFFAIEKKDKFDPCTLKPFDKVLARDNINEQWCCSFFSHIETNDSYPYICFGLSFKQCIPYNDETKHLVGTSDEAPEYYRYWEE